MNPYLPDTEKEFLKALEVVKQYNNDNKEKYKTYQKQYRLKNKEKYNDYQKQYRLNDK